MNLQLQLLDHSSLRAQQCVISIYIQNTVSEIGKQYGPGKGGICHSYTLESLSAQASSEASVWLTQGKVRQDHTGPVAYQR